MKMFLGVATLAAAVGLVLLPTAQGVPPPNATCNSALIGGTYNDITVPPGASCTLLGVTAHNVNVQTGGSLTALDVSLSGDLNASGPASITIDGSWIGNNVNITRTSSIPSFDCDTGPNVLCIIVCLDDGGCATSNSICDTTIGHDLTVTGSLVTAPWIFGDEDEGCGRDTPIKVGNNVNISGNAGRVDFSDNSPLPGLGVGHDLTMTNNTGGTIVEGNEIGHDANCSGNNPVATIDGDAPSPPWNTIGHNNNLCPVFP